MAHPRLAPPPHASVPPPQTLVDQLPLLSGLQRYLDELALLAVPEPSELQSGRRVVCVCVGER